MFDRVCYSCDIFSPFGLILSEVRICMISGPFVNELYKPIMWKLLSHLHLKKNYLIGRENYGRKGRNNVLEARTE